MEIIVRSDAVEISGYVNAVERKSRKLRSRTGAFVERIRAGAFKRAIERNDDIRLLLNHDRTRDLGGTKDGNLELKEDPIGLRARATITDPEVIDKARNGKLVGWSFGFRDRDVDTHDENGMTTRDVNDLDLSEVSILDDRKRPAYEGTLITVRDDEVEYHGEALLSDSNITVESETEEKREEEQPIDYTKYENLISEMKKEENNHD